MQIIKPTLLVDKAQCQANIIKLKAKADKHNLTFRPHFKTHQNNEIAEIFRKHGIDKCTVSSVEMAEYFADYDWEDITIAFPVNILEIVSINKLNERINLNLLVESKETVKFLAEKINSPVGIFIKIDTGYHRTGIWAENVSMIEEVVEAIDSCEKLQLEGLLTHAGHSYHANNPAEIINIHKKSILLLKQLKARLNNDKLILSIGDTPTCSLADSFVGIDEIRCGNFVYYDLTQFYLGACRREEISVKIACPIVAMHSEREEVTIYGGGVHLSKEGLQIDDKVIFGEVAEISGKTITKDQYGYLQSLSQEHGIIKFPKGLPDALKIGDIISIFPVHSCMSANLLKDSTILI